MKSVVSGKSLGSTLKKRLDDDSSILKDFGQISKFAACIAAGTPLTVGIAASEIMTTAGACISLCQKILDKIQPESPPSEGPFKYENEKFEVIFYVMCQKCYFKAIESVFSTQNWDQLSPTKDSTGQFDKIIAQKIESSISKIEYAEVHYFLSIDPVSINIPLYNVYSEWLTNIFEQAKCNKSISLNIVKSVKQQAKQNFHLKISEKSPLSEWIRNYLLINHHIDSSKHITDQLANITDLLKNRLEVKETDDRKEELAWQEYREKMMTLPDDKRSMFNEEFGVRDIFICPEVSYYRQGFRTTPHESRRDLSVIIGGLLSSRTTNDDLIFICGGPGSGKSTLCRMLCDQLARNKNIHPVLLKLRKLRDCRNVTEFIEKSMRKERLIENIRDLRGLTNVVLILDGFDEVVMANKLKLRLLFSQLRDDLQTNSFRDTKIIISGRDTLFPKGEDIPGRSHIIELKPFNEFRIKRWGEKWSTTPHHNAVNKPFKPEIHYTSNDDDEKTALHHLVSWPLTLHLTARIHSSGLIDLSEAVEIEKAYIYKSIISDTIIRQKEKKRDEDDIGRMDPDALHSFLMDIAWQMHLAGKELLEPKEIENVLLNHGFSDEDTNTLHKIADTAVVNAPTLKKGTQGDDRGIEFVHKSFSEYLSAEMIAFKLEEIHHKTKNQQTGKIDYGIKRHEIIRILIDIFCIRPVTNEIIEFLSPMLGTFTEYKQNHNFKLGQNNETHSEKIYNLIQRLEKRYEEAVLGYDLEDFHNYMVTKKIDFNIIHIHSNYIIGLIKILVALYKRYEQKRFYVYEGFGRPHLLDSALLSTGRTLADVVDSKDSSYLTGFSEEEFINGVFKVNLEQYILAIKKQEISTVTYRIIDESFFIPGLLLIQAMSVLSWFLFRVTDILKNSYINEYDKIKKSIENATIAHSDISECFHQLFEKLKVNNLDGNVDSEVRKIWIDIPYFLGELEREATTILDALNSLEVTIFDDVDREEIKSINLNLRWASRVIINDLKSVTV